MKIPALLIMCALGLGLASCDETSDLPVANTTESVVSTPTFSPAAGTYTSVQKVTISCPTSGAQIHYTTDGSIPTTGSPVYTTPIEVGSTTTLQAIAVKSGMTSSKMSNAAYTIVLPETGSVSDGVRSYQTIKIGAQTWMAENLSFAGAGGKIGACYGNSTDSCLKYGRLYTWAEVMNGTPSSTTGKVQGICPLGWHVPTDAEWSELVTTVEADSRVGKSLGGQALKSITGWNGTRGGTDLFGFKALPAGMMDSDGTFTTSGASALFWTATEYASAPTYYAWYRNIDYSFVYRGQQSKSIGHSLRCILD